MKRIMAIGIGLVLAIALGGCSVMGVATRKDMDQLAQRDLSSTEQLERRLANLEQGIRQLAGDTEAAEQGLAQRMAAVERDQQTLLESVGQARSKLAEITTRLQEMIERVEGVQGDVDQAVSRSQVASARSDRAMRFYVEALAREREYLASRLEVLNGELADWDRRSNKSADEPLEEPAPPAGRVTGPDPERPAQSPLPAAPEQATRIRIEPAPGREIRPEAPAPAASSEAAGGIKLKSVRRGPATAGDSGTAPVDSTARGGGGESE